MERIKIEGRKFGRWLVLGFQYRNENDTYYECLCDCGQSRVVSSRSIRYGKSKSCGCFGRGLKKYNETHSEANKTTEYRIWRAMKYRCLNKDSAAYHNYGGRGIKVCKRWVNSYENFLSDMGRRPSSEYSLDRIDNNGNYEPRNCRWATRREQVMNRRDTIMVSVFGKQMYVCDLSKKTGIKEKRLWYLNKKHNGNIEDIVRKESVVGSFGSI